MGAFGVADVEDLREDYVAGDLNKDLGGEGDQGRGKRESGIAELWVYVSRPLRELSE